MDAKECSDWNHYLARSFEVRWQSKLRYSSNQNIRHLLHLKSSCVVEIEQLEHKVNNFASVLIFVFHKNVEFAEVVY